MPKLKSHVNDYKPHIFLSKRAKMPTTEQQDDLSTLTCNINLMRDSSSSQWLRNDFGNILILLILDERKNSALYRCHKRRETENILLLIPGFTGPHVERVFIETVDYTANAKRWLNYWWCESSLVFLLLLLWNWYHALFNCHIFPKSADIKFYLPFGFQRGLHVQSFLFIHCLKKGGNHT